MFKAWPQWLSDADVDERLREGRLGWFVLSAVIGAVEHDVTLKVQKP